MKCILRKFLIMDYDFISSCSCIQAIISQILFLIEVWLMYNAVSVSAVQQRDSVIQMYTFLKCFFPIIFNPKRLDIVPCAVHWDLVVANILNSLHLLILNLQCTLPIIKIIINFCVFQHAINHKHNLLLCNSCLVFLC